MISIYVIHVHDFGFADAVPEHSGGSNSIPYTSLRCMLKLASFIFQDVPGDGACGLWSFLLGSGIIDRHSFVPLTTHAHGKMFIASPLDYPNDPRSQHLVHKMRELRSMVVKWMCNAAHHQMIHAERPFFHLNHTLNETETNKFLSDREHTCNVHFYALAKLFQLDIVVITRAHHFVNERDIGHVEIWPDLCVLFSCDSHTSIETIVSWRQHVVPRLLVTNLESHKLVIIISNGLNNRYGHFSVALPSVRRSRQTIHNSIPTSSTSHNVNRMSIIDLPLISNASTCGSMTTHIINSDCPPSLITTPKHARATNASSSLSSNRRPAKKRARPKASSVSSECNIHSQPEVEFHNVYEALHPNVDVRHAMKAFGEGDLKYEMGTCGICFETRIIGYDSTLLMDKNLFSSRNKLSNGGSWKMHLRLVWNWHVNVV